MTIRYSADVFCDRCGNWTSGASNSSNKHIARVALKNVKRNGWSRQNNSQWLDLCPTCLIAARSDAAALEA